MAQRPDKEISQVEFEDLLEEQTETVDKLYDEIDNVTSEYDYEFVEAMVEKTAKGAPLSDNQWERIKRLFKRYC